MTTIRDVAKLANVSVATVSRVLNGSNKVSEKSKAAVLSAQKQLNFYLNANARALVQRDSQTIGVVVSEISDPYFGTAVRACDDAVHHLGYNLIVGQGYHNPEREKRAIDDIISYQCRGLVVHALSLSEGELKNYLETVPYMVLMNRRVKGYEARCLNCDNYKGECLAMDELFANGHTKIAYISSTHSILDMTERMQGYVDSMRRHDLKVDDRLISHGEPSLEGGSKAALELLSRATPGVDFTAVACYSDVMAAGLMATFHNKGIKMPEEVSIVGFDNLFLSYCMYPPLTTIENPVKKMAEEAIHRSIMLYEGKKIPSEYHADVSLVRRSSIKNLNEP